MQMKIHIILFTIACFLISTFLTGCHTSHKYTAHKTSKQPKFITGIYMDGHRKHGMTPNAIDPTKAPEKPKAYARSHHVEPETSIECRDMGVPAQGCVFEKPVVQIRYSETENNEVRKKYADMLGLKPKEISNNTLYQFIDKWYGTNYRLGGCDISGIDCSGFAQKLYGEVYGIDLLRTAVEQFSSCKRIRHSRDAEEGDLVFFHVHGRRITHVGIYLANDYFVHASTSNGVMISNLNEDYWHKYYAGIGRVTKG